MPIRIIRQDITRLHTDAIVNPTNTALQPGGGVDEAIHAAAGPRLAEACAKLGGCEPGQAVLTPAFDLPAKYIIHTVGPVWHGGGHGERALLESCYTKSLLLAQKRRCRSIAFPLISSGTYGYPKDQVLRAAMDCISEFLLDHEMDVTLVVYDRTSFALSEELYSGVTAYIDDVYTGDDDLHEVERVPLKRRNAPCEEILTDMLCPSAAMPAPNYATLDEALRDMDKGFAETLFDYIDAKGMSDVECYKRANIDRKTFSKIKCSKNYKPSKATVLSFAIALRLTPEETDHLLNTVGMSLSRSSKFDVIVEYFIRNGKYDICEINETLFAFDQMLLGV